MANAKARGKSRGQSTAGIPLATPTIPARPVAEKQPVNQDAEAELETAEDQAGENVEQERTGPPAWLQITSLVLAILGLAVSVYETYAHYNGNHLLGCSSSVHSTFDCSAVITSSQSMVFNIFPVAVLGLAFYVFLTVIMTPWAWRMRRPEVHWLRLGSMVVGMGFVMYLIYAEVYQIQEVCEYCTGVHIVTFLLFCLTVLSAAAWGLKPSQR